MMEEWKADLISTTTASEEFPSENRPLDRRILEHLAEHSYREQRAVRTERYLAETFFPADYGGKIAMYVLRLGNRLARYFASDAGLQQPYQMELVRGRHVDPGERYAIRFVLNGAALLQSFWDPHLDRRVRTLVSYGVPLFVRKEDHSVFTRRVTMNIPSDAGGAEDGGEICWPFVAHGDLLAAVELDRWLTARNIPTSLGAFKADDGLQMLGNLTASDLNVIALGSTRVNGILEQYQRLVLRAKRGAEPRYLPFRLRMFDVVRVDHDEHSVATFVEEHHRGMSNVPVVITRRSGAIRNFITLIASNHGRAVFRAAQILTQENDLRELFADERLRGWTVAMPANFQIVLMVTVLAQEDLAGTYVVEDVWADE
jgi:hypothetical protein